MTEYFTTILNSSSSYEYPRQPVMELQGIPSQIFSDSNEVIELKNDLTFIWRPSEEMALIMRSLRLMLIKIIWKSIKPKLTLTLKPGEIRKLSDELIVEKTLDGRIILYEVIE